MKKQIFNWFFMLSLTYSNITFCQPKMLYPIIGNTPDISINASENFKKNIRTHERIDSIVKTYKDYESAQAHLTKRQIEIYENELEYSKEDHLEVGPYGCSWYCGGGPDSVFSSSQLKSLTALDYKADNVHDFSLRTAWVEGVKGYGIGESLTFQFQKLSPPVTTVEIYNGYIKSEKNWKENARVKKIRFYIDGKLYAILNLEDSYSSQKFLIGSQQGTKKDLYFKFEIAEVYKGEKFEDTCISEIEFDGTGVH